LHFVGFLAEINSMRSGAVVGVEQPLLEIVFLWYGRVQ
jgi:hypothetical protein